MSCQYPSRKVNRQMEQIYLDNAATSCMRKEALDAMMPYFLEEYANPSSIHGMSRTPRAAIQKA
ncbi:MAG: aminotransferase class V-fold PLP-dependent enzyme, partial [Candidatus Methanomethylophilus sp.]|nr:aminotransferase class V-fold PLP-dependent enzyme [Methanomethylophilus sp.]